MIPNFIDPTVYDRSRYTPQLASRSNGERKVLMHISNFRAGQARPRRGAASTRASRSEVPSVLVMVGDGPERIDAEQEARRLGVQDSVFFLGKLEAVAPLLASADLFLLPSQSESFGLSALEALAPGCRSSASRAGGLPEVVRDGETGALCAVGDVDAMAAAAIADPRATTQRWHSMSDARGRRRPRAIRAGPDGRAVRGLLRRTRSAVASVRTTKLLLARSTASVERRSSRSTSAAPPRSMPSSATLLGIVEGITEFLPISSTAHLILASHALGLAETEFLKSFEIIIQFGAILSVVVLYWRRFSTCEVLKKLVVAFIPTGIIGLTVYKVIKGFSDGQPHRHAARAAIGGVALIVFERFRDGGRPGRRLQRDHLSNAFLIGLFQAIAVIPGVSRSAATIVGGSLLGVSKRTIVEFSFILAVPTMLAATGSSWSRATRPQRQLRRSRDRIRRQLHHRDRRDQVAAGVRQEARLLAVRLVPHRRSRSCSTLSSSADGARRDPLRRVYRRGARGAARRSARGGVRLGRARRWTSRTTRLPAAPRRDAGARRRADGGAGTHGRRWTSPPGAASGSR